jgi:hypothetical protein
MTEDTVGQLLRAAIAEHEDPLVTQRAAGLAAAARRRAGRRRTARMAATAAATVGVLAAATGLAAALRPATGAARHPAAASHTPGTPASASTAAASPPQAELADRLDRAFRAAWPRSRGLIRISNGPTAPGEWTGRYRHPGGKYPAEPGFTLTRPGRPPTAAELHPCGQPQGPVTDRLCTLSTRPDGSTVLQYEHSGMLGRHWIFATVATHFRTSGERVTAQIAINTDDGTAIMPDWALGPDDLTRVATDPHLTLTG